MKQREINFRAWYTLAKVMFQPKDLEAYSMALLRLPQDGHFELMQYTGLKDKNGKEIYEGDIAQLRELTFQVYWDSRQTGFNVGSLLAEMIEVIGNIYENPELLEGKNV